MHSYFLEILDTISSTYQVGGVVGLGDADIDKLIDLLKLLLIDLLKDADGD